MRVHRLKKVPLIIKMTSELGFFYAKINDFSCFSFHHNLNVSPCIILKTRSRKQPFFPIRILQAIKMEFRQPKGNKEAGLMKNPKSEPVISTTGNQLTLTTTTTDVISRNIFS